MIWKFLKQNFLSPKGLNWVQHLVSRIGLLFDSTFSYKHCHFTRLPTRQDVVENRGKAYTFAINALFIYTRVLSCMRLLLSPGREI